MADDSLSEKSGNSSASKSLWELHKEAFEKLLARLDADRDLAAERFEKRIRPALIFYFERKYCSDANHLADVTVDRVAKKVSEDETIFLDETNRYFLATAKNVFLEYLREAKKIVPLEDDTVEKLTSVNPLEEQEKVAALVKKQGILECCFHCISKLPEEERQLILKYYSGETGRGKTGSEKAMTVRANLAKSLGIETKALKIRAFRIKNKVGGCLKGCMKDSSEQ
jgi:DNA-directed RNA polymerase specialized sigma24 family protein